MPVETYSYYMNCIKSIQKMKSIALLAVLKEYRSVKNDSYTVRTPPTTIGILQAKLDTIQKEFAGI